MIKGFDFGLNGLGELVLDEETSDIKRRETDDLRLQLAYLRIKSVANNWYKDHIGADLEGLVGRPCNESNAEQGKESIEYQLTFDKLWDEDEFFIRSQIKSVYTIDYNIFFKIKDSDTEDTYSYEISATIDLVKGVNIRYGWEPKK